MNIPIVLLSKSALTVMPLCISIFFTLIFNHTSLSILKVLLISLPFFAIPSRAPIYTLLCCTSLSLGYTIFLSSFFKHPYYFNSANFLLRITLCSLVSKPTITNFIQSYLHQFFDDSHGLKGYGKPSKIPFDWCQSRLKTINNGRDIKQINW